MKIAEIFIILCATFSLLALPCAAQNDSVSLAHGGLSASNYNMQNPKERAFMIAIGAANVLDTYISAEQYKGTEIRIMAENRSRISPRHLSHTFTHHGCLSILDNRAGIGNELAGAYRFQFSLHYNWLLSPNFSLQVGGCTDAKLGILYNTRNSNNPVQVDISLHLAPSASISYKNTFRHHSFLIRYHLSTPLVGLMFSPNYGQSYYEIFSKGNYDHNIVPTTFVSAPSLHHALTFDVQLSPKKPRSKLRLGYLGDIQQSNVNNIKRHHYTHSFLIGWVHHL